MTNVKSLNDSPLTCKKMRLFLSSKLENTKLMQILPFLFLCYFQLVQETESRNRYYVAPLVSDYEDLHNVL